MTINPDNLFARFVLWGEVYRPRTLCGFFWLGVFKVLITAGVALIVAVLAFKAWQNIWDFLAITLVCLGVIAGVLMTVAAAIGIKETFGLSRFCPKLTYKDEAH